jgi:hypothetical protein
MDMDDHTTGEIEATVEQNRCLWPSLTPAARELIMAMDSPGGTLRSLDELGERMGRTRGSVLGVLRGLGAKIKRAFPDEFTMQILDSHGQTTYTSVLFHEELSDHPEIDGMWLFIRRPALHAFLVSEGLLSD